MRNLALFAFSIGILSSNLAHAYDLDENAIVNYLKIEPVYYNDGQFDGQVIDASVKRPVRLIKELETPSSYFVSHFYNQGQFWVAEIPKAGVKNVIMQLALFKGPLDFTLAHAQFRFQMETPIKLYRVKDGVIRKTRTGDVIFTVQAAPPPGKEYEALAALMGDYKMVARLTNSYDRAHNEEAVMGDVVTQYRLKNLSSEQMDALLLNGVSFSSENLYNKDYVATTANCISVAFELIDKSLQLIFSPVVLTIENTLFNGKSPNEKMALDALRERGLINEKSRMENYR